MDFARLDRDTLTGLIELRRRYPERGEAKLALVVASDVAFGMGRMYEQLSRTDALPQRMRVFRDIDAAEAWLLEEE